MEATSIMRHMKDDSKQLAGEERCVMSYMETHRMSTPWGGHICIVNPSPPIRHLFYSSVRFIHPSLSPLLDSLFPSFFSAQALLDNRRDDKRFLSASVCLLFKLCSRTSRGCVPPVTAAMSRVYVEVLRGSGKTNELIEMISGSGLV